MQSYKIRRLTADHSVFEFSAGGGNVFRWSWAANQGENLRAACPHCLSFSGEFYKREVMAISYTSAFGNVAEPEPNLHCSKCRYAVPGEFYTLGNDEFAREKYPQFFEEHCGVDVLEAQLMANHFIELVARELYWEYYARIPFSDHSKGILPRSSDQRAQLEWEANNPQAISQYFSLDHEVTDRAIV